jgi:hypothetical protein
MENVAFLLAYNYFCGVRLRILDLLSSIGCNDYNNDCTKNERYSIYTVLNLEHKKECDIPVNECEWHIVIHL